MTIGFDVIEQVVSPGVSSVLLVLTVFLFAALVNDKRARVALAFLGAGLSARFLCVPPCGDLDGFLWAWAGCWIWN